jgi:hypothetical protein
LRSAYVCIVGKTYGGLRCLEEMKIHGLPDTLCIDEVNYVEYDRLAKRFSLYLLDGSRVYARHIVMATNLVNTQHILRDMITPDWIYKHFERDEDGKWYPIKTLPEIDGIWYCSIELCGGKARCEQQAEELAIHIS